MNDDSQLGLTCSVLTSCSERSLDDLFAEVRTISGVAHFDLMVLRTQDVKQLDKDIGLGLQLGLTAVTDKSMFQLLAHDGLVPHVLPWVINRCRRAGVNIAALATYFPDVTSRDARRRALAVKAVANAGRLALGLTANGCMTHPVVEIVAGTVLDPCPCVSCTQDAERPRVFECDRYTPGGKIDMLCESVRQAIAIVKQATRAATAEPAASEPAASEPAASEPCASVPGISEPAASEPAASKDRHAVAPCQMPIYAVELEPGPTYVINDEMPLRALLTRVERDTQLEPYVALNVDIAHWLIANVSPQVLDQIEVRKRVAHAHIADHPGLPGGRMHTRDLDLGAFTTVERARDASDTSAGEYYPFLRRLCQRADEARQATAGGIPFTGAIAIELEGCNRVFWIHRSVSRLRHAIRFVSR